MNTITNNNGFSLANPNLRRSNVVFGFGFGPVLPPVALLYLANTQSCNTCRSCPKQSMMVNSNDFFAVGHGYENLFAMDTRKKA